MSNLWKWVKKDMILQYRTEFYGTQKKNSIGVAYLFLLLYVWYRRVVAHNIIIYDTKYSYAPSYLHSKSRGDSISSCQHTSCYDSAIHSICSIPLTTRIIRRFCEFKNISTKVFKRKKNTRKNKRRRRTRRNYSRK